MVRMELMQDKFVFVAAFEGSKTRRRTAAFELKIQDLPLSARDGRRRASPKTLPVGGATKASRGRGAAASCRG
jgi:hypothetical protein